MAADLIALDLHHLGLAVDVLHLLMRENLDRVNVLGEVSLERGLLLHFGAEFVILGLYGFAKLTAQGSCPFGLDSSFDEVAFLRIKNLLARDCNRVLNRREFILFDGARENTGILLLFIWRMWR